MVCMIILSSRLALVLDAFDIVDVVGSFSDDHRCCRFSSAETPGWNFGCSRRSAELSRIRRASFVGPSEYPACQQMRLNSDSREPWIVQMHDMRRRTSIVGSSEYPVLPTNSTQSIPTTREPLLIASSQSYQLLLLARLPIGSWRSQFVWGTVVIE